MSLVDRSYPPVMLSSATTAAMATATPTTVSAVRTFRRSRFRSTKSRKCIGPGIEGGKRNPKRTTKLTGFPAACLGKLGLLAGATTNEYASLFGLAKMIDAVYLEFVSAAYFF